MYDAATVLMPSPDLMMRFEPALEGGTLYLFDIESGGIFTGGAETYRFLGLLDGARTLGGVCDAFWADCPDAAPAAVAAAVAELARGLLGRKLVVEAARV